MAYLSDAARFDPQAAYEKAQRTFIQGYLTQAAREADAGYRRSRDLGGAWSRRFRALEATALVWGGDDEETLRLLGERPAVQGHFPDNEVEDAALKATALIHLGRLSEADRVLRDVAGLCVQGSLVPCGAVLRSQALLLLNQGHVAAARRCYFSALDFARKHHERLFEGAVLSNLGTTFSLAEEHDQALSYEDQAYHIAMELGARDLAQRALGNEGDVFHRMGNLEKALELYMLSLKQAVELGDKDGEAWALTVAAEAYADMGQLKFAESFDLRAIKLAKQINRKDKILNASEDLAQTYIDGEKPDEADRYAGEAESLARVTDDRPDILYCHMLEGESAALRQDWPRADSLLHEVAAAPESQNRMRWRAQHTLAKMYQAQGQSVTAEQSYKAAIALVEGARADLKQERSQLSFLTNASRIYDDYIHFLVMQGRSDEALEAADWSRARTLQQGLGIISTSAALKPGSLRASELAQKTNATLLFYWMGEKESYLWAVSPGKETLVRLPAKSEIVEKIERYRRTLLALKDPLRANNGQGDKDGRELYEMLIAPVSGVVSPDRPVVLFTDGAMTQLNFETLLVGGATPHYWIDDATISSAPSIRLFAAKSKSERPASNKLLLLGDSMSVDPALPRLPMAALEVQKVKSNFHAFDEAVFSGAQATPLTYISSKPEQFSYIHFVAHGTASKTDPLESAVILSKDNAGQDSYKLYAREILQHPISARLVTISACNSSGTASFAGEGVVGVSWAFLRAGAHNTIGALWDVSDASTPELMGEMYSGLQKGEQPATALRNAKLSLLHSRGNFSRPFYWAPFQIYSGH